MTIRREGSAHDGTLAPDTHPSASGLRALLRQGKREEALSLLPPAMARAYELEEAAGRAPVFWENSHRAILARLRSMTAADFAALDQGRDCTTPPALPPRCPNCWPQPRRSVTPWPACGGWCCGPTWD